MDHIFKFANLSSDEVADKLSAIQAAADAAAAPYVEAMERTNNEFMFPFYLHEDDHFCSLLIAESTEMLAFIWNLIQLGEILLELDCRCPMPKLTNIGKSLIFYEMYFKDPDQKHARKEKHILLQQIIETPYLNGCLLAGTTVAQVRGMFDEDLMSSLKRVGFM